MKFKFKNHKLLFNNLAIRLKRKMSLIKNKKNWRMKIRIIHSLFNNYKIKYFKKKMNLKNKLKFILNQFNNKKLNLNNNQNY
jgi:hypothetical protein